MNCVSAPVYLGVLLEGRLLGVQMLPLHGQAELLHGGGRDPHSRKWICFSLLLSGSCVCICIYIYIYITVRANEALFY